MGEARHKKQVYGNTDPWRRKWRQAWPDAVMFLYGVGLTALFGWKTSELLWTLWLSATAVGLSIVLWAGAGSAWLGIVEAKAEARRWRGFAVVLVVLGVGGWLLFTLLHFGGFQLLHSIALNRYFPLSPAEVPPFEDPAMYWRALQHFWYFLPAAFLAERRSFAPWPRPETREKFHRWAKEATYKVYLAVVRLHLVLLVLAVLNPEQLWVYALLYALYFFPWSLLRSGSGAGR